MIQASRWSRWRFAVLAIAAIVPRLPAVSSGFGIEDLAYLQYASEHSGPGGILLAAWPYGFYRPLVTLHFELLQPVFGEWAAGYHLASIIVHVLVVWLVYLLISRILKNAKAAFLAALVFAVLPSQTEAIAWACSVGDLWAAALVIVSVLLAIAAPDQRPERAPWFWVGALLAALAACGAKESAVAVGLAAPLAAWLFAKASCPLGMAGLLSHVDHHLCCMVWNQNRECRRGPRPLRLAARLVEAFLPGDRDDPDTGGQGTDRRSDLVRCHADLAVDSRGGCARRMAHHQRFSERRSSHDLWVVVGGGFLLSVVETALG